MTSRPADRIGDASNRATDQLHELLHGDPGGQLEGTAGMRAESPVTGRRGSGEPGWKERPPMMDTLRHITDHEHMYVLAGAWALCLLYYINEMLGQIVNQQCLMLKRESRDR